MYYLPISLFGHLGDSKVEHNTFSLFEDFDLDMPKQHSSYLNWFAFNFR